MVDPWAPLALHTSAVEPGTRMPGDEIRGALVLAGHAACSLAPQIADALLDDPGDVEWTSVQAMHWDGEELRWRNVEAGPAAQLALDQVGQPALRTGRLTLALLTPGILSRPEDRGRPVADLCLWVDRACRTLSTWAERTGHRGPPLPRLDLLRLATLAQLQSESVRVAELPAPFADPQCSPDQRVPALFGTATWTGTFTGLGPLLRAASHVGIGPGRSRGLGEFGLR